MQRSLILFISLFAVTNLWAYDSNVVVTGHDLPKELKSVGVDEHLGATLNLDLPFTDENGQRVPLRNFFRSDKPVLMAMVYYNCPSLCNYHLNGLTDTMKSLKLTTGRDFEMVAVSMNIQETPELAAKKKNNYLDLYNRAEGNKGWHFLVGGQDSVQKLAEQLGFRYQWLPDKEQFAHASVAYVITPEGKISRYLHGIQVDATTLRLSLLEASNGKIGSVLEHALMFCFQFDPQKNKYTLYAWNIMRLGALLTVLLLLIFLVPAWWRDHYKQRSRI